MTLEELYKAYGQAMVQKEILDNQINEIKKQLNIELSKLKNEQKNEAN